MKKTNVVLVLILIINALILWKVWCSGCSKTQDACTKTEQCESKQKCKHGTDKKCCEKDNKCKHKDEHTCKKEGKCKHSHGYHSHHEGNHGEEKTKWLKEELGFTDEQIAEFQASHEEAGAKMKDLKDQIKVIMDEQHETFKSIATEDQLKKMEELMGSSHKKCKHSEKEEATTTEPAEAN